jgi:hypothetical protein
VVGPGGGLRIQSGLVVTPRGPPPALYTGGRVTAVDRAPIGNYRSRIELSLEGEFEKRIQSWKRLRGIVERVIVSLVG